MNGIKLLHIDDEDGFAASLGRRLSRRGIQVTFAATGRDGLQMLSEDSDFDVVLLDIMMPGMDGIKTLGHIKRKHPLVEVIMLTAHANTDVVLSSLGMGAYDFLTKPAEIDQIIRKIEDAVARRKRNLEPPTV